MHPRCLPPAPIRELRELTRQRQALVSQRTQAVHRSEKVLEGANSKLAAVATSWWGKRARDRLQALLDGEDDPATLAERARGRMRAKRPQLRLALAGQLRPFQHVMLPQILAPSDCLDAAMAQVEQAIDERLQPEATAVALLHSSPGVKATAAATLVAELGVAMSRFPCAGQLASWAGVCAGNKQSGGKRLSGKTRRGNAWRTAVRCEVVWANARSATSSLGAQFRRLSRKRGIYKALIAVAHAVFVIVSQVLKTQQPYRELGPDYFAKLQQAQLARHHVRRLEQLGYTVTLTPAPAT